MSLLEDVFLEDEAGEAQELERIIEGEEYDERPRGDIGDSDNNSEKEDEAEEDKRRVDPASTKTKRSVKNPRFILNPARLTGPRGIQVIPEHFKDFKFKGKGHEKEDLDLVLKKLEHWAYRLYPKFQFEDCLKKIETLGKKRPVMVHLHKIRSDQLQTDETVVQKDSSDDETPVPQEVDEFDKLLQQQIDLARTPAPGSVMKPSDTPFTDKRLSLTMPKATSSPSISDEQKERMMRNKRLAEERRVAKLKAASNIDSSQNISLNNSDAMLTANSQTIVRSFDLTGDNSIRDESVGKKDSIINEPNIIIGDNDMTDSSKEKDISVLNQEDVSIVNQVIAVDIHKSIDTNIIDITKEHQENETVLHVIEDSEQYAVKRNKHNRSNVIDSSDSDDDCITTVNESVAVDVHNISDKVDNSSVTNNEHLIGLQDVDVNHCNMDKEVDATNIRPTDVPNNKKDNFENQIAVQGDSENNVSKSDNSIEAEVIEDDTAKEKEIDGNRKVKDNSDVLKENEAVTEDLMDVDFSDDF